MFSEGTRGNRQSGGTMCKSVVRDEMETSYKVSILINTLKDNINQYVKKRYRTFVDIHEQDK